MSIDCTEADIASLSSMCIWYLFLNTDRCCVLSRRILDTMRVIFTAVCTDFEAELVEFDGEKNHVHLLVNYPPKVSVSRMVNSLKGVSSRLLKKQHPDLHKYYLRGALWSPSYFAGSCGGAPIFVIRQYIEQQETPD